MLSEPPARPDVGPGDSPVRRTTSRPASPVRVILIVSLVVAAIAFLTAGPLYRHVQSWRASTLVSQAAELAQQHFFTDAIARYQSALRVDPRRGDALRGLADIYSLFEKPAAIPAWRALLALPSHSEQDTLDFIGFTIKAQRFDLAEMELSRLLAVSPISIPTLVVASELFHRQGNPRRALDFAEDILRREPENRAHRIRVVRFLLAMPDPVRQREGFLRLGSIPALTLLERVALFQALDSAPSLPSPETITFLDRLPPLPTPSATDLLAQTDLRIRLAPDSKAREPWIQAAIDALRQGSPEDQLALCRWLNRIREHTRLLNVYSLSDAIALPPVLPAYLDALGQAERWEALQRAANQPLPIDPWLLATFRSAAADGLKQDSLAQEHWRRALDFARRDPSRLQAMGDIALRLGSRNRAIEAYDFLANDDLHRTAGYRRLARVFEEARDTERLRLLMREWASNAPDDPVPNTRYAYLCALVRRNLDDAHARLIPLVENHPARAAYRITLAFLELRQDQPQAALQRLERTRGEPGITPQLRLVQALVLDANSQSEAAREIARSIRPESLLPEELELLRKLNTR